MKRLLSIITLIVCVLAKADAQYYSVNYDKQTVAAMAAAYGTTSTTSPHYKWIATRNLLTLLILR